MSVAPLPLDGQRASTFFGRLNLVYYLLAIIPKTSAYLNHSSRSPLSCLVNRLTHCPNVFRSWRLVSLEEYKTIPRNLPRYPLS